MRRAAYRKAMPPSINACQELPIIAVSLYLSFGLRLAMPPIATKKRTSVWDMACSLSLAPLAGFYSWRGRSTAGPSHYRTIASLMKRLGNASRLIHTWSS